MYRYISPRCGCATVTSTGTSSLGFCGGSAGLHPQKSVPEAIRITVTSKAGIFSFMDFNSFSARLVIAALFVIWIEGCRTAVAAALNPCKNRGKHEEGREGRRRQTSNNGAAKGRVLSTAFAKT